MNKNKSLQTKSDENNSKPETAISPIDIKQGKNDTEEVKNVNPYVNKTNQKVEYKQKPKGYTLKVLSWILVILGFCLLAFILINVVITQSFISANKNDIGAIISFIVFGWIFLIFGISGGSIILIIITLLATILSVSHLIVVKGKSKAGWVILSLVVLLIICIIVILMLAKPFTSLGLT